MTLRSNFLLAFKCGLRNFMSFTSVVAVAAIIMGVSPEAFQSMAFEDIIAGKRLTEDILGEFNVQSRFSCALLCNKDDLCRSFNLCASKHCELNKHSFFSIGPGQLEFIDDPECVYYGMRKTSKPVCNDGEQYVDIQNETSSELCTIYGKRVDREWGSWTEVTEIDNATEWKVRVFEVHFRLLKRQ